MQRISLLCICYFVTDGWRSQGKKQENALQEQAAFLLVATPNLAPSSATSKQTRRSSALQMAIPAHAAKIDKDKAVNSLSKALEAGVQPNIKEYNAVIHACAKFGDKDGAVQWLSKVQVARLKPNIITYTAVINACAKSGDMEKAVEWLSKAHEARLKPDILLTAPISMPARSLAIGRWLPSGCPSRRRPG